MPHSPIKSRTKVKQVTTYEVALTMLQNVCEGQTATPTLGRPSMSTLSLSLWHASSASLVPDAGLTFCGKHAPKASVGGSLCSISTSFACIGLVCTSGPKTNFLPLHKKQTHKLRAKKLLASTNNRTNAHKLYRTKYLQNRNEKSGMQGGNDRT